jgi:uncharacterized protein (TIGR04255 family)
MSKKYKDPPLIEALCEFYFAPETSQDFESIIDLLYEKIHTGFPKRDRLQLQASQITLDTAGIPEITQQLLPLERFQSNSDRVLIQVGQNLLTVNHLKPYTSWEAFLPSVEMGFHAYREVVQPTTIHRVALRYINRIEIMSDRIHLEDYFEFRPFIGQKILQDLAAFTLGIQIPHEEARDMLHIQLASVDSGTPNTIAMILDLTYSLVKQGAITLDDISEWLINAHTHIEDAFEACITDQLRNLFEEVKEC